MKALYDFMDESRIFRRGAFILCWFLILKAAWWTPAYADKALGMEHVDGANTAMVIGAILTPLGALAAAVFKFYNDGRVNDVSKSGKAEAS